MSPIKRISVIAAMVVAVAAVTLGQVPTHTKMRFTINVPDAMIMGGYQLPAGHYILLQDSQNPNLFRLYHQDETRPPLATIYTVRGRYWAVPNDGKTVIGLEVEESGGEPHPTLRGFRVPFDDPWEVVSVTARADTSLIRVR